jgi:predicted lipid-binding transport protein (Tim44 family)
MNKSWLSRIVTGVVSVFLLATFMELLTPEAEARAGRGRSSGKSSFGSNKQSQTQQPASQNNYNQSAPNAANPAMNNRGSMMRNIAGGMAGGFLGSMLFSSMGNAAGVNGAAGGGGIGMLEILLIAGLAFFGFRWWKSRQKTQLAYAGTNTYRMTANNNHQQFGSSARSFEAPGLSNIDTKRFLAFAGEAIDQEHASDIFFKIQGAWTRRDFSAVKDLVTEEMKDVFDAELAELRKLQEINRLENIAVRRAEITDNWNDDGQSFSKVRFTANLLDYTVNEVSGAVVSGSMNDPVKFEEDWIFVQPAGSSKWRLAGIEQI